MQYDGVKINHALQLSAMNTQSSELPFKSWPSAVYTGHLILAQKSSTPQTVAAVIKELTGIL
jgi:hypothetical protein